MQTRFNGTKHSHGTNIVRDTLSSVQEIPLEVARAGNHVRQMMNVVMLCLWSSNGLSSSAEQISIPEFRAGFGSARHYQF